MRCDVTATDRYDLERAVGDLLPPQLGEIVKEYLQGRISDLRESLPDLLPDPAPVEDGHEYEAAAEGMPKIDAVAVRKEIDDELAKLAEKAEDALADAVKEYAVVIAEGLCEELLHLGWVQPDVARQAKRAAARAAASTPTPPSAPSSPRPTRVKRLRSAA